jgi:hypothetical protein
VEHLKKFISSLAGLKHENLHTLEEFAGYTMIQPSEYLDLVHKVLPMIYASPLLLADQTKSHVIICNPPVLP